jgi:hypothetical protein
VKAGEGKFSKEIKGFLSDSVKKINEKERLLPQEFVFLDLDMRARIHYSLLQEEDVLALFCQVPPPQSTSILFQVTSHVALQAEIDTSHTPQAGITQMCTFIH